MSAPIGNDNAAKKNRMFSDELRKMYVQKRRDILKACEALAKKAEDGDIMAIRELADRLEGKVSQAITGPDDGPIEASISVKFVRKPPGVV